MEENLGRPGVWPETDQPIERGSEGQVAQLASNRNITDAVWPRNRWEVRRRQETRNPESYVGPSSGTRHAPREE